MLRLQPVHGLVLLADARCRPWPLVHICKSRHLSHFTLLIHHSAVWVRRAASVSRGLLSPSGMLHPLSRPHHPVLAIMMSHCSLHHLLRDTAPPPSSFPQKHRIRHVTLQLLVHTRHLLHDTAPAPPPSSSPQSHCIHSVTLHDTAPAPPPSNFPQSHCIHSINQLHASRRPVHRPPHPTVECGRLISMYTKWILASSYVAMNRTESAL